MRTDSLRRRLIKQQNHSEEIQCVLQIHVTSIMEKVLSKS